MGLEKFIQKEYDGMSYVKNWCFCYCSHLFWVSFIYLKSVKCYVLGTILGTGDTVLKKEVKPALMKLILRGETDSQVKKMYVM